MKSSIGRNCLPGALSGKAPEGWLEIVGREPKNRLYGQKTVVCPMYQQIGKGQLSVFLFHSIKEIIDNQLRKVV
jgi:hypothetical protein